MTEETRTHQFFLDGKPYLSSEPVVSGSTIKQIAGVSATYQLFLEEEGDTPDQPISDGTSVDLRHKEKHFFAVPPATFG
jgi:hypothetical protein